MIDPPPKKKWGGGGSWGGCSGRGGSRDPSNSGSLRGSFSGRPWILPGLDAELGGSWGSQRQNWAIEPTERASVLKENGLAGPPVRFHVDRVQNGLAPSSALSHRFFFGWEGSRTKVDYKKRLPLF